MAGVSRLEAAQLIAAELSRFTGPLVFATGDCVAAIIAVYRAMGLQSLGPDGWDRPQAVRRVRVSGGDLGRAIDDVLEGKGWSEWPTSLSDILDLGLCEIEGQATLAVHNGVTWTARGPGGPLLLGEARRAWRAPSGVIASVVDGY